MLVLLMESSILSEVDDTSILRTVLSTCYWHTLDWLPASRLTSPRSGLERSDFVPWPFPADSGAAGSIGAVDPGPVICAFRFCRRSPIGEPLDSRPEPDCAYEAAAASPSGELRDVFRGRQVTPLPHSGTTAHDDLLVRLAADRAVAGFFRALVLPRRLLCCNFDTVFSKPISDINLPLVVGFDSVSV